MNTLLLTKIRKEKATNQEMQITLVLIYPMDSRRDTLILKYLDIIL